MLNGFMKIYTKIVKDFFLILLISLTLFFIKHLRRVFFDETK